MRVQYHKVTSDPREVGIPAAFAGSRFAMAESNSRIYNISVTKSGSRLLGSRAALEFQRQV
jgi:hypothetical protein